MKYASQETENDRKVTENSPNSTTITTTRFAKTTRKAKNQGLTLDEAMTFAEQAVQHDIEWFEEPVVWCNQYEGMNTVREESGLAVTAGQSEIAPAGCKRLLQNDAVDVINYDSSLGGGSTA